jgi:hypothetical protein
LTDFKQNLILFRELLTFLAGLSIGNPDPDPGARKLSLFFNFTTKKVQNSTNYFLKKFWMNNTGIFDLALSCNPSYLGSQSIVGWFEVERSPPGNRRISRSALRLLMKRSNLQESRSYVTTISLEFSFSSRSTTLIFRTKNSDFARNGYKSRKMYL